MKDHGAYFIVRKKGSKETAVVKAFREWLLSELVETNRKFAGMKGRG
jgi:LysR family transcriptional regulator, glycine cleavage system transcriptional activator